MMDRRTKALRRRILTEIGEGGMIASRLTSKVHRGEGGKEWLSAEIRDEIERLIESGQIIRRTEDRGGRHFANCYRFGPAFDLCGESLTVRQLADHPRNVHGLAANAIKLRLLRGLSAADALAEPPTVIRARKPKLMSAEDRAPAPAASPSASAVSRVPAPRAKRIDEIPFKRKADLRRKRGRTACADRYAAMPIELKNIGNAEGWPITFN